jgi:hypothetical protein
MNSPSDLPVGQNQLVRESLTGVEKGGGKGQWHNQAASLSNFLVHRNPNL